MDPTALGALATTAVSLVLPYLGKAGAASPEIGRSAPSWCAWSASLIRFLYTRIGHLQVL